MQNYDQLKNECDFFLHDLKIEGLTDHEVVRKAFEKLANILKSSIELNKKLEAYVLNKFGTQNLNHKKTP